MIGNLFAPLAMKISGGIIAVLLLALPINGCVQYREGKAAGREAVMAELRKAETEAQERAASAVIEADKKAAQRAEAQGKVIADQIERIEKAEREERNPLDEIF